MDSSFFQLALRAAAALAMVAGLIYLTGWLSRRVQRSGALNAAFRGRRLKVLESARTGMDAGLYLVEVDEIPVLVAVSRGGVAISTLGRAHRDGSTGDSGGTDGGAEGEVEAE